MFKESHRDSGDPTLTRALFSLNPQDRLPLSLNGHKVTLGLPNLINIEGKLLIEIPNSPHIFPARVIRFITQRNHYRHTFTLFNQVVILGHGNPKRRDTLGWEFTDGQDPLKITADFNHLNTGLPRIDTIVCCRPVIPTLRVGALIKKAGQVSRVDKLIPNTQFPSGWINIPSVIIPKNGKVRYYGEVNHLGIESLVISEVSDFYQISKKGKPINLRKHFNRR